MKNLFGFPLRRQYIKLTFFIGSVLLASFIASLVWTTWREIQQKKINLMLVNAITRNDSEAVITILDQGADPNTLDAPQQEFSFEKIMSDLLRRVSSKVNTGTPALILAVTKSPSPYENKAGYARSVTIVKALLDRGAWINGKDKENADVLTYAVEAGNDLAIVQLLIQHRTNLDPTRRFKRESPFPDWKNPWNERTPLMTTAGWGRPNMLNLLLDAGAKVDAQTTSGRTALMYAVDKGRPENVACLLAYHANIHLRDRNGNTALSLAREACMEKKVTSFTHEIGANFWSSIVIMLERADSR